MSSGTSRILLAVTIVVLLATVGGLVGVGYATRPLPQEARNTLRQQGAGATASSAPGSSPAPGPARTPVAGGAGGSGGGTASAAPAAATPQTGQCPVPREFSATGVRVGLTRLSNPGPAISFGVPFAPGALADANALRVSVNGAPVAATTRTLLTFYDANGAPGGPRAVLIQLPTSVLTGECAEVAVSWQPGAAAAPAPGPSAAPFSAVSFDSPKMVTTATRSIARQNGQATLVETKREERKLFDAREPVTLAIFPPGYLAATGLFGSIVANGQAGADYAGIQFILEQIIPIGQSGSYQESYALNPTSVIGPNDTNEQAQINGFEGWLYDRCLTYLLFAATTGDIRFQREGLRSCSFYASKIQLNGENRGTLTIVPEPDDKYSHVRGMYTYYALTGDEAALEAGRAMAEMWERDPFVITPYRQGRLRGPDKLWTERQIGVGLEGMVYGHLLTGDRKYFVAAQELITTIHRHVTGDAAALATINPDAPVFPPQNCLIHNAEQASEGNLDQPFCSGWMPILMVDALLAYQGTTNDRRVDEIFIRLTRFLRDTGTGYFKDDVRDDTFLSPSVAYNPQDTLTERRLLVPLYGAGVDASGKRVSYGDYDDTQHCVDATVLVAAGLRALRRTNTFDQNPIGPFPSEGASFAALHNELAFCAQVNFVRDTRSARDPSSVAPDYLETGLGNPTQFVNENEIGWPIYNTSPQRKISWYYNTTLSQFGLLREAGVTVPELRPGIIQPGGR